MEQMLYFCERCISLTCTCDHSTCKPRNAQIADLQQKVLHADKEGRLKQHWDSITTIVKAKSTLKILMSEVRNSCGFMGKALAYPVLVTVSIIVKATMP